MRIPIHKYAIECVHLLFTFDRNCSPSLGFEFQVHWAVLFWIQVHSILYGPKLGP